MPFVADEMEGLEFGGYRRSMAACEAEYRVLSQNLFDRLNFPNHSVRLNPGIFMDQPAEERGDGRLTWVKGWGDVYELLSDYDVRFDDSLTIGRMENGSLVRGGYGKFRNFEGRKNLYGGKLHFSNGIVENLMNAEREIVSEGHVGGKYLMSGEGGIRAESIAAHMIRSEGPVYAKRIRVTDPETGGIYAYNHRTRMPQPVYAAEISPRDSVKMGYLVNI